jgi:hypothetical protein
MQQGGSNHHHELFISLSSGPTHKVEARRGQHPTKTHRGPFFILYWKRIHLHSGGCHRRKVQAIKNLCLLMPRTGRDLAAAFAHSHESTGLCTKNVVMCSGRRKRERRRGCSVASMRPLRIWIQSVESLHLHTFMNFANSHSKNSINSLRTANVSSSSQVALYVHAWLHKTFIYTNLSGRPERILNNIRPSGKCARIKQQKRSQFCN